MDRLLCEKCSKPMFFKGTDIDPSSGLQTTEYGCFSLNSKHIKYKTEPIPGWKKEREINTRAIRVRTSPEKELKILTMLAQSIPYSEISEKAECSYTTICRLKQITLLAAMGMVLRGMKT